ncbi:Protein of unknown function [Verrucomicrobium sp. GAS474]|nr:Protein of unknown function [Verrucomicrobium sp. GAS474]
MGESRFIAFFDECGDHSLTKIDKDFPLFLLSTVIVERSHYVEELIPAFARLKLQFWDHEGINLHSREIRKATGAYSFLQVPAKRQRFLQELSATVSKLHFTLFITCIRKDAHLSRYSDKARNPYDIALTYTFERVLHFLEGQGESNLPVIAEARGKQEDDSLKAAFYQLMTEGTQYNARERFQKIASPISFCSKYENVAGIQLADLCAHPAARSILKPDQSNQAFDLVKGKIYQSGRVSGWKVFP